MGGRVGESISIQTVEVGEQDWLVSVRACDMGDGVGGGG